MEEKNKSGSMFNIKIFLSYLKKFLIIWIIVAVLAGVFDSIAIMLRMKSNNYVSATINFSYDGIEQGLDPSGNKFNYYDIKDKSIVSSALKKSGLAKDDSEAENVRNYIVIDGDVPSDVISQITKYNSVISDKGVSDVEVINDTSYYPVRYTIKFNYDSAGFSRKEAASFLNSLLYTYGETFYKKYGYNDSIENTIKNLNYDDYDYVEILDILESYYSSLSTYINSVSENDNTRFVSTQTNLSLSDIKEAIDTFMSEDIDVISAYVLSNSVTRDKNSLISYYDYRIKNEQRNKKMYQEQLSALQSSIDEYQKTNAIVFGSGTNSEAYTITQPSKEYDSLINKKIVVQNSIGNCDSNITLYKKRLNDLNLSKGDKNSDSYIKVTDEQFTQLKDDSDSLLNLTNQTLSEYFKTVKLKNTYQIVNKASSSILSSFSAILSNKNEILAIELFLIGVYSLVAFFATLKKQHGKKNSVEEDIKDGGNKNDN